MYKHKIIVKNKRNVKERLELTLDEFKIKFAKELRTALNSYKSDIKHKNMPFPPFMHRNTDYERSFYSDLRWNFNNNSRSVWYIFRIL